MIINAKEVIEAIKNTKALIEQGWTKGAYARNQSGLPVGMHSKSACQFCLAGAIFVASDRIDKGDSSSNILYEQVFRVIENQPDVFKATPSGHDGIKATPSGHDGILTFNDSCHSISEIINVLDGAIESLSEGATHV